MPERVQSGITLPEIAYQGDRDDSRMRALGQVYVTEGRSVIPDFIKCNRLLEADVARNILRYLYRPQEARLPSAIQLSSYCLEESWVINEERRGQNALPIEFFKQIARGLPRVA